MKNIWNKNYILLLQGQLVSTLGDALYTIALSLFMLELTGSATLVGTIMGLVTIPRIILGPFAGTIIDRYNKKLFIILPDLVRGITISLVALLAYQNRLNAWILIIVAIIDGICIAFFNPTIETTIPLLVEDECLVQANSIFNMLVTGFNILGQTLGGALYNLLGAPLIFLINGISYIFSAGTETFISLPAKKEKEHEHSFFHDMKQGITYIFADKGLFILIAMSFFLNFLFGIIRVLIIPWFVNTNGFGEAKYGFFNGACSVGMIVGMLILSLIKIKDKLKYYVYTFSVFLFIILVDVAAIMNKFGLVMVCFVFAFAFQIVFNTLMNTTIVLNTAESLRGKIASTRITLCMAASPIGNFIGGILGDRLPANYAIMICSTVALIISVFFLQKKEIKKYFGLS